METIEQEIMFWQTILVLLANQNFNKKRTYIFILLKNFLVKLFSNIFSKLRFVVTLLIESVLLKNMGLCC